MKLNRLRSGIKKGMAAIAMTLLTAVGTSAHGQIVPDYPFYPPTFSAVVDLLNEFPSDITHVRNLGEHFEGTGEPLVGLFISDNPTKIEDEPVVLFTGVIHGREPMGMRAVLELADDLVSNYDIDPKIRDIVDNYLIVIIPTMNQWGYENRFRTNRMLTDFMQTTGVDLNGNGKFGWDRCDNYLTVTTDEDVVKNGPDCYEVGKGKYHGPVPNSEFETDTMQSLVEYLKPVFGVVFHTGTRIPPKGQVLYPYLTRDRVGDDGYVGSGDEHFLEPMKDHRVAVEFANIMRENVLLSRTTGLFCTDLAVSPLACDLPESGAIASAGTTGANYYALTGMIELGVETHGGYYVDGIGQSRYSPWIQDHLYQESPSTNSEHQLQYDIAREYARTYADGMKGLMSDFICDGKPSHVNFDGPGFTGRVVDSKGLPLAATIKVLELDTTLQGDYIDLNQNPNDRKWVPYGNEDFKLRVSQSDTGRFFRLLPRDNDTASSDSYTIEISMRSKLTQKLYLPNPGMGSCLKDLGDIVLLADPDQPITAGVCTEPPQLIGIPSGGLLPEKKATIHWTSNGCHFWVYAGDRPNGTQYLNQSLGSTSSVSIGGYPSDSGNVYMTLKYRNPSIINDRWKSLYYSFEVPFGATESNTAGPDVVAPTVIAPAFVAPVDTKCSQAPTLTSHEDGDTLAFGSDTIAWTSNGCHYWVYAGDRPNSAIYHNQSMGGAHSVALSGYPGNADEVHLTLLYRNTNIAGAPWKRVHFSFETQGL